MVRRELVKVARDLREGRLDPNTGNAVTNCFRAILATFDASEVDKQIAELKAAISRAAQAAAEEPS